MSHRATPLRAFAYTFGKFLSNLMVPTAMALALAVTALVMVVVRGEAPGIDLAALYLPILLSTLPMPAGAVARHPLTNH
ncbi:hypothetical protein DP939_28930 [Spongiactinospora rosea]|uniref:Uncharacterized protein n=1 Tax=Spongiactinospora rosea TaxID=2248750 RepID=A0A366LSH9_9ACTN|nr:hypothetical protein [Spongiactinospora rosea]RBQ16707.1 hypothetical protein DP939_28930 [Spongiactinospora rosea]